MIARDEVLAKTKKIIMDNVPEMIHGELNEDTVINSETAVDSMGFILVMSKLEGAFDVRIPDDKWSKMITLGDIVDTIMSYLPKDNA